MKVGIHEIIRKVITYLWLILRNHLRGMSKKYNSFYWDESDIKIESFDDISYFMD